MKLLIKTILLILLIKSTNSEESDYLKVGNESMRKSELCSKIGIEGKVNDCGYCSEGYTGLDSKYGFDCNNVCDGNSYLDCNNVCNGNSFIDSCTGLCINESNYETANQKRDCRGFCSTVITENQYELNECNRCLLKIESKTKKSLITECINNENINIYSCNNCIDKQNKSDVPINCDHCIVSNTTGFTCDKNPSVCGCNDSNNCFYISDINPKAVPKNTEMKIQIFGYFSGLVNDFKCKLNNNYENNYFLFPLYYINKTQIECKVNLTEVGPYELTLKTTLQFSFPTKANSNHVIVYDRDLVEYSNMNPKQILTTDMTNSVTLTFQTNLSLIYKEIPLRCLIIYTNNQKTIINGDNWMSCTIFDLKKQSQLIEVIPTFDGIHSLSKQTHFTLTVMSPSPRILHENSFISQDGLYFVIYFERAVDILFLSRIQTKDSCDLLLTKQTISQLESYGLKYCKWVSKVQLLISLSVSVDEKPVKITFNEKIFKESAQEFALLNEQTVDLIINKIENNVWSYDNRIEIVGPTLMPLCGTIVLNGYIYSAKGSKSVQFKWSVTTLPPSNDLISDKVMKYIVTNDKLNLILDANSFSLEPYSYRFILKAKLTDGTYIEASHQIFRYSSNLPVVTIFPTTILASNPLSLDQSAMLYSEVIIPDCIANPEHVVYEWKTNNPKVKFDFSLMSSPNYRISKDSLVNERVVFELNVFLTNQSTDKSEASVAFNPTKPIDVVIISNHISMASISRDNGLLIINSNISKFMRNQNISYQWSCYYTETQQPCVLYSNFTKLLINREIQNQRQLVLNSNMFRSLNHNISLELFIKSENIFKKSFIIKVNDGNAPQVFMLSVHVKENNKLISNTVSSDPILVPSHTSLIVKGMVNNDSIESIIWSVSQSIFQLQTINKNINNEIHTELHLHENQILPFGSYNITLKACKINGTCNEVNKQLIAGQTVSDCKVIVDSTNSSLLNVMIDRCNTPPDLSPLSYQLFITDINDQNFIPVSRSQFSPMITYNWINFNINITKISVEVCDCHKFCQIFNTTDNILINENNMNANQTLLTILNGVGKYSSIQEPISALSLLIGPLLDDINFDRDLILNLTVEQWLKIKPKNVRNKGDLTLIYYVFGEIFKQTNNFFIKNNLVKRAKYLIDSIETVPDIKTLDQFYTTLLNNYEFKKFYHKKINQTFSIYVEINETQSYFWIIRNIILNIIELIAKQIPIGHYIKIGDNVEFPQSVSIITHQKRFYEIKLETKYSYWKNVSTFVKFNEQRLNHYLHKTSNTTMNSIIYSITLIPDESPFLFHGKVHKLSPIVDISIHSPITGEKIEVLAKKHDFIAIMKVTLTGNQTYGGTDFITRCQYYNEQKDKWDTEGVTEFGISGQNGGCLMYHLSAIVILRVNHPISTDYILGVIVAVMMGVLVFAIMVVFFVQKKDDSSTRVVPQTYSYRQTRQ